jgi:hypothetical protein
VGDGEKLITYLNSALKVRFGTDIFFLVPKQKLNHLRIVAKINTFAVVRLCSKMAKPVHTAQSPHYRSQMTAVGTFKSASIHGNHRAVCVYSGDPIQADRHSLDSSLQYEHKYRLPAVCP